MPTLLLAGGRVIDPVTGQDHFANVLIDNEHIAAVEPVDQQQASGANRADRVIDCTGLVVTPGFVDLHSALRDPGFEADENTASGTMAALAGGFTTIASLPDTLPVVDNRASAEYAVLQAARARHCRVLPLGAVTRNCAGTELADLGQLVDGGAAAFTDAKQPVQSAEVLRRALEYARMFGKPIFTHPQDPTLTAGGVMHEGYMSTVLGLRGIPGAAEEIMVGRDIALAALTDGHVHLMSLSTKFSLEQVRLAKSAGIRVTADVAPHHLCLTDESLAGYETRFKLSPPLRTADHVAACIKGLKDGTIDAICSDHQPHAAEKTERELDQAPFGAVGLETLLPVCIKVLIEPGHLDWLGLVRLLTTGPANVLGISAGTLTGGKLADITLIDPSQRWTIRPDEFYSRGRNTPFGGMEVNGRVVKTIVDGEVRFERR